MSGTQGLVKRDSDGSTIDLGQEEAEQAHLTANAKRIVQYDSEGNEVIQQFTAFGEQSVAEPTPVIQVHFPYNINSEIVETRNNNGTVTVVNNKAHISTGAAANQSAALLTITPVKYNPGQGGLVRFTALYTTGVANSTQWVGLGNSTDGYFFGYNGTDFGILRRQGGLPEVRRLAITTASNTSENITITLDGDAETVAVNADGADSPTTRVLTANTIAAHDFSNVGKGWEVHNMGANIFFTSFAAGSKTGTYSLVNGGGEAAGTFSQSLSGVDATDTIVTQANWNKDKCDGTGTSGITCDFTKGNVYQIRYQWLGFGDIDFFIENPETSRPMLVHRVEYANSATIASVNNPTLPLCGVAKNTSNTSDVAVEIGSMGGFIEGRDVPQGLPHSLSVEKGSVGTTETPIMTLHSHDIYQSTINRVKIRMSLSSVSIDGTKPATVRVRKNAILTGPVSFSPHDANTSTIHQDTGATGVSGGEVIFSKSISKDGGTDIDFKSMGIELNQPDFLTLSIEASASTTDTVSTFNWQELF